MTAEDYETVKKIAAREKLLEERKRQGKKLVFIKRFPHGKCSISTWAAPDDEDRVMAAFANAIEIYVKFDENNFREALAKAGMDSGRIEDYVRGIDVFDDTYLREKAP